MAFSTPKWQRYPEARIRPSGIPLADRLHHGQVDHVGPPARSRSQRCQGDHEDAVITTIGGCRPRQHGEERRRTLVVPVDSIHELLETGGCLVNLAGTELHLDQRPTSVSQDDDGIRLKARLVAIMEELPAVLQRHQDSGQITSHPAERKNSLVGCHGNPIPPACYGIRRENLTGPRNGSTS